MNSILSPFRRMYIVGGCVFAVVCLSPLVAVADVDVEDVDCTDELEQIPRDGSSIEVSNPWLSYSGHLAYSSVGEAGEDDVVIEGHEGFELENLDADSHFGVRLQDVESGEIAWSVAEAATASFAVDEDAAPDESAPRMGEGDVEVSVELMVYEEFPVMYRQWKLSFPGGEDEATGAENMRYFVEFTPEGEDNPTDALLVTPPVEVASEERVEVMLGGREDRCFHTEPSVAVGDEADVQVRAVDLAGNVAEEGADGRFEGVPAEDLAEAHDEFNQVIGTLEGDGEGQTTE